jgi:hypothetical protein
MARGLTILDRLDGDDIRVIERRNHPSLALKLLEEFQIRRHVPRQALQGNLAMQPGISAVYTSPVPRRKAIPNRASS